MVVLAVIPARGGSKAVADKNLRRVGGRPLIEWTIDAVRRASSIDRAIVSTDSETIAATSRAAGADVPFMRPPELARDDTPGIEPILHALKWYEETQGTPPSHVVCLQPTSPLRSAQDIDAALALANERDADAVVSVTPARQHPQWMKTVDDQGRLHDLPSKKATAARRQELPPVYALNGAIYLAKPSILRDRRTWYTENTYAYVMPPDRSVDIDSAWDLRIADLVLSETSGTALDGGLA